jgi:photosystem II stability/assembly factor-like uncharacterized protein
MNLDKVHWMAIGPAPVDTPGVSLDFSAGRIEAAAPDPGAVDTMYVGASGGGVWKTGVWNNPSPIWLVTSDDQPSINFGGYHPLVVHPAHHETVFGVVSGPGAGVLKSTNFGLSWQLLGNNTFEGGALSSIAVHPTDVNTLYVSVWLGGNFCVAGVYKSTDGGASWNNTTTFHAGFVTDVIIARYDPHVLFAGMIAGNNGAGTDTSGIYNSPDEGMTWHLNSGNGPPTNLFVGGAIRLESASQHGHAYATVFYNDINSGPSVLRYRTTDNSQSWQQLAATPGTPELRSWHVLLGVDHRDGTHVFVNDAYSLYESHDSGQSWKRADVANNKNIGDDWVNIGFDANNKAVVTADRDVYHYDPATKAWEQHSGNLQVTQLYTLTLTPQNTDRCCGIAQDHVASMKFSGSILWNFMPGGSGETGKILIDPGNQNLMYAANPLDPPNTFVARSTNGGQNWTVIHKDGAWNKEDYNLAYSTQKSFVMDPSNSKRLLLGTNKVFECKDATIQNTIWKAISGVFSPSGNVGGQYITALAIAASDGKVIYGATADGHVWTTPDDGAHWNQNDSGLLGPGVGKVVDLRIDPANPKRAFAATNGAPGKNIWYLDPATGKWKNISGDMPWNLGVIPIAVDWRYTPNVLYVGSARGVYRSIDMGVHWTRFGLDMPNTSVSDLQTLPSHNILAASTFGRGVFEILLSDPKIRMEAPAPHPLPSRPAKLPEAVSYEHIGDLNLLPGKKAGEPLVDARVRLSQK